MEECKDCDQSVGYTCVGCEFHKLDGVIKQKNSEIATLKLALKELGEMGKFYADEKNWRDIVAEEAINDSHGLSEGCFDSIIYEDCENDIGGKRARETLLKHKELLESINKEKE